MTSDLGEDLAKTWETCRLVAYDDAYPNRVLAIGTPVFGTLTIGWGCTGPDVHIGLVWTQEEADTEFNQRWAAVQRGITRLTAITLTDGQRGALESLGYNIGLGRLSTSALLRTLNVGDYDGAASHFHDFVYSHGKYNFGLFRRRLAELALWHASDAGVTTDDLNRQQLANS